MVSCKLPAFLILSAILLLTALIITLTHSGFYCELDTASGSKVCGDTSIGDREVVCEGSVFRISVVKGSADFEVMCPWSTGTIVMNVIGVLIGFIFTAVTLLQRRAGTKKFAVRLGIFAAGMLAISTIIMGANMSGGSGKCEEFEAELEQKIGDSTVSDCSIAAFGWDVALMSISVLLLGFEAYLEYKKYRFGDTEDFTKADELTHESDYQVRFFDEN